MSTGHRNKYISVKKLTRLTTNKNEISMISSSFEELYLFIHLFDYCFTVYHVTACRPLYPRAQYEDVWSTADNR